MRADGIVPDVAAYTLLLRAHLQLARQPGAASSHLADARGALAEMRAAGVAPNALT